VYIFDNTLKIISTLVKVYEYSSKKKYIYRIKKSLNYIPLSMFKKQCIYIILIIVYIHDTY